MGTVHRVVFGDCRTMKEIPNDSIHLTITSPPYYNAPFDYPGLFSDYDEFLVLIQDLCPDLFRVIAPGRIACFVTDDMLVKGQKYPVVADVTRLMLQAGFRYRDRIVWVKPKGYVRISRRSGVVIQHPYPMYYYPDNIQESILIFQKGRFDYSHLQELDPKSLSKLFSYFGETVLDPFLGSGTTMKVAQELGRSSWGYEIDLELKKIIKKKLNFNHSSDSRLIFIDGRDARKLRSSFQRKVETKSP